MDEVKTKVVVKGINRDGTETVLWETEPDDGNGASPMEHAAFQVIRHVSVLGSHPLIPGTKILLEVVAA